MQQSTLNEPQSQPQSQNQTCSSSRKFKKTPQTFLQRSRIGITSLSFIIPACISLSFFPFSGAVVFGAVVCYVCNIAIDLV